MTERGLPSTDGAPACPFVAFGDDREGRSTSPDHRHRCFAESPPAPRAVAHQEAYCLSSAFPVCPTFQDWARREAAHARGTGERAETAPTATAGAAGSGTAIASGAAGSGSAMAAGAAMTDADDGAAENRDADDRNADDRNADDRGPRAPERTGRDADDDDRGQAAPGDLPVRRNPPRDWAAPPPWASGQGANPGTSRSAETGSSDLLSGRSVEGRGLAGSAADRLAGGPPPAPSGTSGGSGAAAAGAAAGSAAAAGWSASAAGSASAPADDELAGLVQGRSTVPLDRHAPDDRPPLPPTGPEADSQSLPRKPGRRPSVSSTRPPGPEIPGPAWERMRRYEAYPTIRSRPGLPGLPGMSRLVLLAGALVIAAIALFMLPALLGVGGGGASSSASPTGSGRGPVATSSAEPLTSAAPTQQVYIVKSGDTMSKIAAKFGLKPEDLCAANSATIKNCDKIALGQQIIIPAPGSGGVVTPSGSAAP